MQSFLTSIMNVAQVGLTLNPASKEAYLIPRYDRHTNSVLCTLEPSYIGIVKLLTDTGNVVSIQTNIVYDGDEIVIDMASDEKVKSHIPYVMNGNQKPNIKFVYAIATLNDGTKQFEYMSYDEIAQIRDMSESYKAFKSGKAKTSIWNTWESEMCRKTVIKRIAKYLPRTDKHQYIDKAIELTNVDYQANDRQIHLIESLVRTCCLSDDEKSNILISLNTISAHDAEKNNSIPKRQPSKRNPER